MKHWNARTAMVVLFGLSPGPAIGSGRGDRYPSVPLQAVNTSHSQPAPTRNRYFAGSRRRTPAPNRWTRAATEHAADRRAMPAQTWEIKAAAARMGLAPAVIEKLQRWNSVYMAEEVRIYSSPISTKAQWEDLLHRDLVLGVALELAERRLLGVEQAKRFERLRYNARTHTLDQVDDDGQWLWQKGRPTQGRNIVIDPDMKSPFETIKDTSEFDYLFSD
jgi:hypothetical protein